MRVILVCGVLLCACDTVPDSTVPSPPDHVATLNVSLEGDGTLDPTMIHLAIVWFRDPAVFPKRALEPQELFINSHSLSWPVTFESFLLERPTYDTFYSSPSVGARPGRLVAYLDDNANGKLDFTKIDATAFADRIVGYATGTTIMDYTTVDMITQLVQQQNVLPTDVDVSTPFTLPQRSELRQSCHMLEDWRPHAEYQAVFGGIALDPNDPSQGPWDREAASDAPCPNDALPVNTKAISCDAPLYQFHAEEIAQTSPFIGQNCAEVIRVCEVVRADPNAPGPWPCPCDPSKYECVEYEGGL